MTRYNYSMSQNYLKSLPKQVHTPYILEKCWIVKKKEIVMVIKYNGSSGNVAHVGGKTDFDWKINFAFDDDVYLNNCLTPFSLHLCVSYFDQPSTSNTMEISGNGRRKVYISNFHKSCFYQKCRKNVYLCVSLWSKANLSSGCKSIFKVLISLKLSRWTHLHEKLLDYCMSR